ncbi:hypothetical protein A3D01_04875 [Candidatus Woesebacteria bacterium RIFCSPHIGHO2_02_FULL_39_13]|uniref:Glycosyltransferase 2-like domain-containing protein n=1 Tax=Candidatus Woesebacteria bacterium RIFCSPHIGHO2_02_FULL_39_13 TaxID=1802505 RepID=A0A1F7Z078_9BACT|nr:MAG: hypothetical protein A2692_00195 [Candidatus Woesebacteria bacterium RIFCSPHIGHO2_01_FULL_39_95]OGM32880.1 MAG: hypothetical protein A3D01_04875 [Candidatus Woesebacteria bacterium RIFCSPHIGHO2_02_FULL_39_13]OGM74393.1 MAG: hypothetical protein A3H19_05185 [Candidatus Woesebacteria bacterium RIFCSPLOWO2_12_FULL_39_9]
MKKKMKNTPFVSVVVPMYNAEKFILPAIRSILKTAYANFEIVIVDDISTDESYRLVFKHFSDNSRVRIFKNRKKLLAAGSRNKGVELSKGEYIALLDHDVLVDRNWLTEAMKVFKKNPTAGTVQGVVLDITRRNIIQHAGIKINAYLGWVISLGFGQDIRTFKLEEKEVFADATGLIFKKEAWERVGGFDEKLAINVDDWDFNWRIWLAGYKQILAPKSLTYHWSKKQQTRDAWIKRTNWEFHFAKVPWLFIKNYELVNVIKYLPIYLVVGLFRGVFNILFRLNPAVLAGYIKAVCWIIINFGDLLQKRNIVQSQRKISDTYLMNNVMDKSFVFEYFIRHWLPIIKLGRAMSSENY